MAHRLMVLRGGRIGAGKPAAGGTPVTIFTQALDTDTTGFEDATNRMVIPVTGGSGALNQIRVTFEASAASGSFQVDNASIGISNGTDADTTAVPLELKFGGVSGFTIAAGNTLISDWLSGLPAFTASDLLVVVYDLHVTNGNFRTVTGLGTFPPTLYLHANANSYNSATTPAGFSSFNNRVDGFNKVEVQ